MGLNNLDDSREGIEKFLARNPHTCLVSTEGEKIVGVIMAGHDGRRAYIYHTAVDLSHQGRGIGSRLVEACLLAIKEEGVHKVALLVFDKNEVGNRFWGKCGFIAREDVVYRNRSLSKIIRLDT